MKKILILSIVGGALLFSIPIIFEPEVVKSQEVATGDAAVTLTVTEGISLTVPTENLAMTPAISVGNNSATNAAGGAVWTVKTNSADGWKLEFNTTGANCLATGDQYFTDYTEASEGTPETWSIATGDYEFGFGVYGIYKETKFGGTDCTNADMKYMGFNSTTLIQVAHDTTVTSQTGAATNMCVKAAQGTSIFAPTGSYSCTVTGTATSEQ